MDSKQMGRWAFLLGILVAVILGFTPFAYSTLVLFILGLIVGFMNIGSKETHNYLVAVIALLVIGFSGLQVFMVLGGDLIIWLETVLTSFITFVAASGLVVALKTVLEIEKE